MRALILAATLAATLALSPLPATAQISAEIAATGIAPTAARLAALPDPTPADRFALGGLRFLGAIEAALQTRWTHGIGANRSELPVLRLPIPRNPAPEPYTAAAVVSLFTGVQAGMVATRAALAPLGEEEFGLDIRLGDLWFDINRNGARDRGEGVIEVAGLALTGADIARRAPTAIADVTVRFDRADADWLAAYSEFLSGAVTLMLAFDPAQAIEQVLAAKSDFARFRDDQPMPSALDQIFGEQADGLMMIWRALETQPDPAMTRAARDHLIAMIGHNRAFWARVEAETDDAAEWIPNDRQRAALGFDMPAGTGARWQAVLDDAEELLTGRLLIPHWRFGSVAGINMARMFEDPAPVDVAGWIHGAGLIRWAEAGTRVTAESWAEFDRMVRGNAFMFAVFLN